MIGRILCWIGRHAWDIYDEAEDEYVCSRCEHREFEPL